MPRPVGTPFWGESHPIDDGIADAGSPELVTAFGDSTTTDFLVPLGAQKHNTGTKNDSDDFVRASSGDAVLFILDGVDSYLELGDTVTFTYVIRGRGTGSIDLTDDVDPSWSYTPAPANSLGTVTVSSGGWVDHEVPTASPTVANILDGDGIRLHAEFTGSVEVDWIALAVRPTTGVLGGWSSALPSDTAEVIADRLHARGATTGFDDHTNDPVNPAVDYTIAWGQAIDDLGPLSQETGGPNTLGGLMYETVIDDVGNATWQLRVAVAPITLDLGSFLPIPAGTDGVDYIRRPDRTAYDDDAFFRFTSGDIPHITGWLNSTVTFQSDFNDLPSDWRLRKSAYRPMPSTGTTTMPDLLTGDVLALSDASVTPSAQAIDLTNDDTDFNFVLMSSFVTDSDPGAEPDFLTSHAGQFRVYFGVADWSADPSTWLPLTAQVLIPAYQVWLPTVAVSWVRGAQRGDGLGGRNPARGRSQPTYQGSIRGRGSH